MSLLSKIRSTVGGIYYQLQSRSFEKKIFVIESDDWGSLRTESLIQKDSLYRINNLIKADPYIRLDGLASVDDLTALYETLSAVKDASSNCAVLTANVCTANPNFFKIKESDFQEFHYEPFTDSIKNLNTGFQTWNLWQDGIKNGLFRPQLHGREHLHVMAWLKELQFRNEALLKAFDLGVWSIPYIALATQQRRRNLQAALDDYGIEGEDVFKRKWLKDSVEIFQKTFGFNSETFIAPAYIWHSNFNKDFVNLGIKSLQGIKLQYQPKKIGYNRKLRFLGEIEDGICFFPRNVFFEPSLFPKMDWFSVTMKGIDRAFSNKQPAIIGSHRINFIGKLEESNRTRNLKILKSILMEVVKRYPDVQFASSDKLLESL